MTDDIISSLAAHRRTILGNVYLLQGCVNTFSASSFVAIYRYFILTRLRVRLVVQIMAVISIMAERLDGS
jgi:hypothetical protein